MKQKKNLRQIFSVFLTCMMIIGVALANDHIFVEGEGKPQAEQQVQEGEPEQGQEQEQGDPGKPGEQEQGQGDSGKPEEVKQRGGQEKVDVDITEFTVTNADVTVPPDGFIANQIFRLNFKWNASKNGNLLNEGDYFEIELPDKFKFPTGEENQNYYNFKIYADNGTDELANAVITPQEPGGGKIRVTFTNYVNGKLNILGEMHLTARWNQTTYPITGPVEHDIEVGTITKTIKIKPYKKPNYETEVIYKTAGGTLTGEGWVRWRIRVNAKEGNLTNVVIKDNLWAEAPGNPEGIEYVSDQFILYELSWNADKNEFDEINGKNVSNQINISPDKRSFTYNMGNMNEKGYILHYRTTYKQGLLLKNRVELKSDKENPEPAYGEFLDAQAGGGALPEDALKGRIKIIKFDGWDTKTGLKGAKFTITKKGTSYRFDVKTDEHGVAVTMPLLPGEYTIKETAPPQHYIKDDQEYTVPVSSDKLTRINIGNAPETIDIKVRKVWNGPTGSAVTAVLKGSDGSVEEAKLTAPTWEHTWNVRKYDVKTGELITYTVEEKDVPDGYSVEYTKDNDGTYIITNKLKSTPPELRNIAVTKVWQDASGNNMEAPVEMIEVELFRDTISTNKKQHILKANGWTGVFESLEKNDNTGTEYKYTVKEVDVEGNPIEKNGKIQLAGEWYTVTYDGSMEKGFVITNKKTSNTGGGGSGGGGGQSGGGSGGTGGDDSNKPKPNDSKPNDPKPNDPKPSDDSTGMGGATPPDSSVMPDGSVVPNDSTTATNTVAPKNHKTPKNPVLTDKQGVKKTAQASRRLPKTGEGANPTLYAWMLGALGSMLVLVGYRKRKP